MLKPSVFEFSKYTFQPSQRRVVFEYKQHFLNGKSIPFTETIILPKVPDSSKTNKELLNAVLQGLHLMIGISYFKFYCSKKVVHHYQLSREKAHFWNTMYKNGLGEFYFKNKLDPKNSPKFSFSSFDSAQDKKNKQEKSFKFENTAKILLGFSGGKDSILAAELFKEQGIDFSALFIETNRKIDLVDTIAEKADLKLLKIKRYLDEKVFHQYPYNGHIPISAIFGFLGVFYAVIYGYSYFTVANEYSSNFGNLKYKGININHQWSKSIEFENLFREYVKNFISPDIGYFSLLRPFFEIRIAKMFAKYKKYFPYFAGCNKNFVLIKDGGGEQKIWCGACPKCAFTFVLLSPFLSKKELLSIFKKNLYQDETLLPLLKDILGIGTMKPFDCVGTFEESCAAFTLGAKKFKTDVAVKTLLAKIKIDKKEIDHLFKTEIPSNAPDYLKFLGMENALILGYGKEGKMNEKYLKKNWPKLKITIADEKRSKQYLQGQKHFDIAIKTPGINKSLVKIPYTTATNIFFSKIKELGNNTIGVTGSKGKSTTASLISAILKKAGKKPIFIGNIGNPMLGTLLRPIRKDEIFVIELSSYQLDDIRYSPNVAILTSIFPEHMDFHEGIKNYYKAKKNIVHYQGKNDIFIYNPKYVAVNSWKAKSKVIKVKTNLEQGYRGQTKLIGSHNQENIQLAITATKALGVKDAITASVIEQFQPLPHRLEFVSEFRGIKFYDDAISTTPESTIMAIQSLKNVDTIFLGGEDRGYDFSQLEKIIKQYKIRNIVLFPKSGNRIKLKGSHILKTKSMKEAVAFAFMVTKPGKICLLSSASPSYSLWKNFEEKGDQFKHFVRKLGA